MEPFINKEDFQLLFRSLTTEELKSFDLKAQMVSDTLRQEARNVGEDIDLMLEQGELFASVLKEVTMTVLARWLTQPTDFPTTNESIDSFDNNIPFYNTANSGIFIKKSELARLGILSQKIIVIGGEANE